MLKIQDNWIRIKNSRKVFVRVLSTFKQTFVLMSASNSVNIRICYVFVNNCIFLLFSLTLALTSLLNYVPCMLKTCSRANMPCMLTCSRSNVSCVLTCSLANVPCVFTCSRAKVPCVLT